MCPLTDKSLGFVESSDLTQINVLWTGRVNKVVIEKRGGELVERELARLRSDT